MEFQNNTAKYIESNNLQGTLAFLMSYSQLGVLARTFMLEKHKSMYQSVRAGENEYASYSTQEREHIQVLVYLELLDRLCLLIEDLSTILHALQKDLRDFLHSILTTRSPKNVLTSLNAQSWSKILRYAPLTSLNISLEDKTFLDGIRHRNLGTLAELQEVLVRFLDLHWPFFNRHKHGNTLLYGMGTTEVNGEETFAIPAVFDQSNPHEMKAIIVSPSIYDRWQLLLNTLVLFVQYLIDQTIAFIERGGKPFALYQSFCPLTPEEKERADRIVRQCDKGTTRAKVSVDVTTSFGTDILKSFSEFYLYFDHHKIQVAESATALNSTSIERQT